MPKNKQSVSNKLNKFVSSYPGIFTTDGTILFCKACSKSVSHERKSQVEQHLEGKGHQDNVNRRNATPSTSAQPMITQLGQQSKFNEDLCEMLISCDIPLNKLGNPQFVNFLEKYTSHRVPHQTTMRQKLVPKLYENCMDNIRSKLDGHFLYGSVDETTDASGRYIANFIVGILSSDEEKSKETFLLNTACLEKTNHATIAKFVDESLCLLGPGFKKENFMLFVTDAAPYMVKAGKHLTTFYVNMIHVTCLAHAIHRVCEFIRGSFEDVDGLISNCKKIFLKCPARLNAFKEALPDTPLPPRPVITRWGTWLSAALYYARNFDDVKDLLETFDETQCSAIPKAKRLMASPTIQSHLACIEASFSTLPECIVRLETSHLSLAQQLDVIEKLKDGLANNGSEICDAVAARLDFVLNKNPGYKRMTNICNIIQGTSEDSDEFSPHQLAAFKFAPMASVDVERSFSTYKQLYRDNRHNFSFENLKCHLIIHCNSKSNK